MLDTTGHSRVPNDIDRLSGPAITFTHPDDVLQSRSLSVGEKRALLASWASDAHAVPNLPTMRQLESGAIVTLESVLAALRSLDASDRTSGSISRGSDGRQRVTFMSRWRRPLSRRGRRDDDDDDDDDPPPCPAASLPPAVELELRRRRDAAWRLSAA